MVLSAEWVQIEKAIGKSTNSLLIMAPLLTPKEFIESNKHSLRATLKLCIKWDYFATMI